MNFLKKSFKALQYLGIPKLWYYTLYQIGLRTGHYQRLTPHHHEGFTGEPGLSPYTHFPRIPETQKSLALADADAVLEGKAHLFGGQLVPLNLEAGASNRHWSLLERIPAACDLKFIWEPGRFGWAISLARAYALSGNPAYAEDFWDKTNHFLEIHPPNLGRQWQSAQEVAIRLMVLVFCDRVVAQDPASTPDRRQRLWQALAEHALRIPPTLVYARAQNNNHLLSEAAGLYTAGVYLPEHPRAAEWRKLGWHWLNWGFQHQIDEFGTYIQHSTNYHRLMLQLALFTDHIRLLADDEPWPQRTKSRLAAATNWLWALTDPHTGRAPNLGANDGAYIFPLAHSGLEDFRPVVTAAGRAFLRQDIYSQSSIYEMNQWFELEKQAQATQKQPHAPDMLRVSGTQGRAFIHTAHFQDRPSHADQLHVDLWWQGANTAQDPGTYQYSGEPPWENALAAGFVHNTLTLDGRDQMLRAGRFLWLDWAQAEILAHEINEDGEVIRVTTAHNGFRNSGACHKRSLTRIADGWEVFDQVLPFRKADRKIHQARITWMLPDWAWQVDITDGVTISNSGLLVHLQIKGANDLALFRCGESLYGTLPPQPTWGWIASNYGVKQPALMVVASQSGPLPLEFHSLWRFGG
mgnify:CR=1 FL=1